MLSRFQPASGTYLALLAFLCFSIGDACVRTLHGSVPPLTLCFIGCVIGLALTPILFPKARLGDLLSTRRRWIWWGRAACAVIGTLSSLLAFSRLDLPSATSIIFLAPIVTAILSQVLLHEKVGPARWVAFVVGLIGVGLVLQPEFHSISVWHLCAAVCAMCGVGTALLIRAGGEREAPVSFFGAGLLGPLIISAPSLAFGVKMPAAEAWLPLVGYALCGAIASVLLIFAFRTTAASHVALAQYTQLIWSVLLGALLFHTYPHGISIIGLAAIMAAGLVFALSGRRVASGAN